MAIISMVRPDVQTDIKDAVKFTFSETAAPKLAQMLGNYLYSDKEYAVISELCANAYDIHKAVGKGKVPIKVQLPTPVQSEFVVRDFGTGLSEHDVYKYLTSYGESNKTETNEQIGFWGLGSKSPAAVTDSWTVISYHEGVKSHYEVFVDQDSMPSLKKVFAGPTTETGLEVRVPIKKADTYIWDRAASKAFRLYDTKPALNRSLHIDSPVYNYVADGWAAHRGTGSNMTIVTTMREYDLDRAKIKSYLPVGDLRVYLLEPKYGSCGLSMMFGIGEIDLSISREQIQYNKKTIDAILARLQKMVDDIRDLYLAELDAIPDVNHLTFRVFLEQFSVKIKQYSLIEKLLGGNQFGVAELPGDISYFKAVLPKPYDIRVVSCKMGRAGRFTSRFSCWRTDTVGYSIQYQDGNNAPIEYLTVPIKQVPNVVVVLNDVRGTVQRIKAHGEKNTTYIVTDKKWIPYIKTVKGSSFPKAPSQIRKTVESKMYVASNGKFHRMAAGSKFPADMTVAVNIKSAKQAQIDCVLDDKYIQFCRRQGYTIIGYKGEKTKFLSPERKVKEIYNKYLNDPKIVKEAVLYSLYTAFNTVSRNSMLKAMVEMDSASPVWQAMVAPMQEIIDYWKKNNSFYLPSFSSEFNQYRAAAAVLGKPTDGDERTIDFDAIIKICNKTYPLLQYSMNEQTVKYSRAALEQYITLIDNQGA